MPDSRPATRRKPLHSIRRMLRGAIPGQESWAISLTAPVSAEVVIAA
jgi:hypothetical protein